MTALQQLLAIKDQTYINGDGDIYKIELLPALNKDEMNAFAAKLPGGHLPEDIRALLEVARGFEFGAFSEVTFTLINHFGFENIFPRSIELAGDGFGNFWILDIDSSGQWDAVFFVCHDPAVVVRHSNGLAQFLEHVAEFATKGEASELDTIHEKTVFDIWSNDHGFIDQATAAASGDAVLRSFAAGLNANYVIADLRNKPNKSGFAWGKYNSQWDKAIRHGDELLWAVEKTQKKGLLSRLFGG